MSSKINELLDIMARLRDPQSGCPWDLKQTYATIVPYTLEEAYEVAEAIEKGDLEHLKDELGDLLFQVVFYAQIAREEKRFTFDEVVESICEKMIRRHPHVFSDLDVVDEGEVKSNWEKIKQAEREQKNAKKTASLIDGVNEALPALSRAKKLQKRAANIGFDWPDHTGVVEKLREELAEVEEAIESGDAAHIEEEVGDLLFVAVNLANHVKIDAEAALRKANRKFERRFRCMEEIASEANTSLTDMDLAGLDGLWNQAKKRLD
ncbi:MAG: nucleoside triphosphate pyrophosphohydrolase [Gammaproteobacteria bacterium]|nr:nucleoside triphosphate pyrophosphohydrolase [Gammaproteobacteria bacterium]